MLFGGHYRNFVSFKHYQPFVKKLFSIVILYYLYLQELTRSNKEVNLVAVTIFETGSCATVRVRVKVTKLRNLVHTFVDPHIVRMSNSFV